MKAGTFGTCPSHSTDPYVIRRSKPANQEPVFRPVPGPKSTPVKSIITINVNRLMPFCFQFSFRWHKSSSVYHNEVFSFKGKVPNLRKYPFLWQFSVGSGDFWVEKLSPFDWTQMNLLSEPVWTDSLAKTTCKHNPQKSPAAEPKIRLDLSFRQFSQQFWHADRISQDLMLLKCSVFFEDVLPWNNPRCDWRYPEAPQGSL